MISSFRVYEIIQLMLSPYRMSSTSAFIMLSLLMNRCQIGYVDETKGKQMENKTNYLHLLNE